MENVQIKEFIPLKLNLIDDSWKEKNLNYSFNKRVVVRAIVCLRNNKFAFINADRNDIFGKLNFIETSGGGVENNESLDIALKRELHEELGLEVEIITYLGCVTDYYNLINRENVNHYYLVIKKKEIGNKMTALEKNVFHIKRIDITLDEAIDFYTLNKDTRLGHLIYQRELPFINLVKEILAVK